MEQCGVSPLASGQHAEDQVYIRLSKVPISLEDRYIQNFNNLQTKTARLPQLILTDN